MKKIFIIGLLLVVAQSCTDEPDGPTDPSTNASAKVNGAIFTSTETKATNTGTGIEVKLKDNSQEIHLQLDDIIAGTYTVKNSSGGRTKNGFTVTALLIDNTGTVFYGTSGTITLTIASDGKVAGVFTFSAKSSAGPSTSVTDGKFDGLIVGDLSSLGCLLRKIDENGLTTEFTYGSDGNVSSQIIIEETYRAETNFYYAAGKMVRALSTWSEATTTTTSDVFISYDAGGKVNRIDEKNIGSSWNYTDVSTFTYDGLGKLSKIIEKDQSSIDGAVSTNEECFTYTGTNLTKYAECNDSRYVYNYSLYDSKSNPGKLLLKAFGNQAALVHHFADGVGHLASENNAGKLEYFYSGATYTYTYTYNEYNGKGFPVKITETDINDIEIIALTYSNCN